MRILFITLVEGDLGPESCSDYQLDMLFHGLIKSGHEVHTTLNHWWMYESEKISRPKDFTRIWGKGFTIYGTLTNDDLAQIHVVGLSDITKHTYDAVIIGIHHTSASKNNNINGTVEFLANILKIQINKIIVIDGWDRPYVDKKLAVQTKYFKRELYPEYEDYCLPISFAFPAEKIVKLSNSNDFNEVAKPIWKFNSIAPLIPVNQSIDPAYMQTYKYNTEEEYYEMYRSSEFALTSKKGGWDTLRHYEIIANNCLPLFVDIENCPAKTLHIFPKKLCHELKEAKLIELHYKDGTKGYPLVLQDCSCLEIVQPTGLIEPVLLEESQKRNRILLYFHSKFREWITTYGTTQYLAEYVLNHAKD